VKGEYILKGSVKIKKSCFISLVSFAVYIHMNIVEFTCGVKGKLEHLKIVGL